MSTTSLPPLQVALLIICPKIKLSESKKKTGDIETGRSLFLPSLASKASIRIFSLSRPRNHHHSSGKLLWEKSLWLLSTK